MLIFLDCPVFDGNVGDKIGIIENTAEELGNVGRITNVKKCCEECRTIFSESTFFVFNKELSQCRCLKTSKENIPVKTVVSSSSHLGVCCDTLSILEVDNSLYYKFKTVTKLNISIADLTLKTAKKRACIPATLLIKTPDLPPIDIFLNPERSLEKLNLKMYMKNLIHSFLDQPMIAHVYPNLFRLLWYSMLPCFPIPGINSRSMLKQCKWAGQDVHCSDIFQSIPTDSGICCSFNHKSALKSTHYSNLVEEMQNRDRILAGANISKPQVKKALEGRNNGLQVTLDQNTDQISAQTLFNNDNGFKVFIGKQSEFPLLNQENVAIATGFQHFVKISGSIVSTTKRVQNLNIEDRGCIFPDESNLDFYTHYTHTSCRFPYIL